MTCTHCVKEYEDGSGDAGYPYAFCSVVCETTWVSLTLKTKPAGELLECCRRVIEEVGLVEEETKAQAAGA